MADTEAPSSWTRLIQRALIQVQPLLSASGRTASWRNGLASPRTDVTPQDVCSPDFLGWQKSKFKKGLANDITCPTEFPYGSQLSLKYSTYTFIYTEIFSRKSLDVCFRGAGCWYVELMWETSLWSEPFLISICWQGLMMMSFWPVDFAPEIFIDFRTCKY